MLPEWLELIVIEIKLERVNLIFVRADKLLVKLEMEGLIEMRE